MNFTKNKLNQKMNLPEVPTLGSCDTRPVSSERHSLVSQRREICLGWLSRRQTQIKQQTPAGLSHQKSVCQWPSESIDISKIIHQCFNTLIG